MARKKGKKLSEILKSCHITDTDTSTPRGTKISQLEDAAITAKFPKITTKLPPIIVHKTRMFEELKVIRAAGIDFYMPTKTNSYYLKLHFPSTSDLKTATQYFVKMKVPFHTFGYPSKRKMKVIIRNLPKDTDLNIVKEELTSLSIPVVRVHKLHTKDDTTRPLFLMVVVPLSPEGQKILQIKEILGHKVFLEPPKPKAKQCHRCQRWGHCQRYCHGAVKCVKCAGDHISKKCPRDSKNEPPKCANCLGSHTASYRECSYCPDSIEHKKTVAAKAERLAAKNKEACPRTLASTLKSNKQSEEAIAVD